MKNKKLQLGQQKMSLCKSMRRNNKGFSLIEAMIALAIASIALLGLIAGQLKALKYAQSSFQYTVALIYANNSIERIWGDICGLQAGNKAFDANYLASLEPPINAPGNYTQTFTGLSVGNFATNFTVNMKWMDNRTTDNEAAMGGRPNTISLNASYPNFANPNCVEDVPIVAP